MKRIILCIAVLCIIGACSEDLSYTYSQADDAIFMLTSTNWEAGFVNVGGGHARFQASQITGDRRSVSVRVLQFNPKRIKILQKSENRHYRALGDILYTYANPETYNQERFATFMTNFGVNAE